MSEQSSTGERTEQQQQAFQICQNRAAQVKEQSSSSSRHSKYVRTEQHR